MAIQGEPAGVTEPVGVEEGDEMQVQRVKPGRPRGIPLPAEHRARIAAAMASGEPSRRGWETRRRNQVEREREGAERGL